MNSETSEESSSKIRQMSWFLTTQLLETALKEASKGEDKSKISMDDIQKLADVLHRTEEDILQRSAETSELYQKTGAAEAKDSENEVLFVGEKDETITGEDQMLEHNAETDIADTQGEVLGSSEVINAENESDYKSVEEESESTLETHKEECSESLVEAVKASGGEVATERKGDEHLEQTVIEPSIDAKEEKSDAEVVEESRAESETVEAAKIEVGPLGAEKMYGNVSQRKGSARIPDVISRAYGRSLEVISSAVPPLRDSSIPKGLVERLSTQTSQKTQGETPGEEVESTTAVEKTSSTNGAMSIENSLRLRSGKSESEVKLDAKYAAMTLEDRAFEVLKDLGMVEIHELPPHASMPKEEQPSCIASVGSTKDVIARSQSLDEKDETVSTIEIASMEDSAAKKLRSIAAKKSIQHAPKQQPPNHNLSHTELSAKYAEMTLEDRAFEILKDLGMIEIHEFSPRKPSTVQDHSGVRSHVRRFEETQDKEVASRTSTLSTDSVKKETLSKRERFFRPIRKVFEKSKEKVFGSNPSSMTHSATPPPVSEAVRRARQQPKSPSEEALLAEKYGQLPVEDRAYAILCDLGMIESV